MIQIWKFQFQMHDTNLNFKNNSEFDIIKNSEKLGYIYQIKKISFIKNNKFDSKNDSFWNNINYFEW